uniref:palmitoyl-CoA hydrolase n=1 Tax=Periophthalmus magnuspinnatus TaxID=409849 RepID=A0A3B4AEG5_9GOBI
KPLHQCINVTGLLCVKKYTSAYKPVFIVHGLFDGPKEFKTLTNMSVCCQSHPGTEVTTLDLYDGLLSVKPLWTQVRDFRAKLEARLNQTKEGAHLLCFSQGGVICRGLLSVMPNHNIHSFISLSAPLAGQYGNTDYLKKVFPKYLKKNIYKVCYNKLGQQLSICQYWNGQTSKYFKGPILLCFLICSNCVCATDWRDNFLRIKKLVLIGGPDDGVITPWQSSLIEMKNQEYYRSDVFGLKTLDFRGDVSMCVQSGVAHVQWHSDSTVFTNCIQDWLT